MFNYLKIGTKLSLYSLLISVLPAILIAGITLYVAWYAFEKQIFSHLESVRAIKKTQIERVFAEKSQSVQEILDFVKVRRQVALQKIKTIQESKKSAVEGYFSRHVQVIKTAARMQSISQALEQFEGAFEVENRKIGGMAWLEVEARFSEELKAHQQQNDYYDLFLIDQEGDVVYNSQGGIYSGKNVSPQGELANSALGMIFQKGSTRTVFQDFLPYSPENQRLVIFAATPLFRLGELAGVFVVCFPSDRIDHLMQRQEGLAKTEETYLVGKVNDKTVYRSNRLDNQMITSVLDLEKQGTDVDKALAGYAGTEIRMGINNKLKLSGYAPLNIPQLNWGIISVVDLEEVLTPEIEGETEDFFTKYLHHNDFYDLLLVHPLGNVFYSVRQQADYQANLLDLEHRDTLLGKVFQEAIQSKTLVISDYALYPPSNNLPMAFIAQSLSFDKIVDLVVVLKLDDTILNRVMLQREGLGETGEAFLVGSDKLMRSNAILSPKTHSIQASFADPTNGSIDTIPSRSALAGQTSHGLIKDYRGIWSYASYTPLNIGKTRWALIVKIGKEEAINALWSLEKWLIVAIFIGGLIILYITYYFVRQFRNPLIAVNQELGILAQGRMTISRIEYQGVDEIAEIVASIHQLKQSVNSTIRQANAIATGDYTQDVKLLSTEDQLGSALAAMVRTLRNVVAQANAIANGDYNRGIQILSEEDQLGQALSKMTYALRETTTRNLEQDWLKTGRGYLHEKLRGEQDIHSVAKNTIDFLAHYVGAPVGLFYFLRESNREPLATSEENQISPRSAPEGNQAWLQVIASYGYPQGHTLKFSLGEGLVGQAALEQKAIFRHFTPEEYTYVKQSALIKTQSRYIAVMPFLYEQTVKGVIELGCTEPLMTVQQEFLQQIMPSIAIAVNAAESRTKLQALLRKSQSQSEELQVQQEELQQTNEELQSQSEELRVQQEELRQVNEELQKRTEDLEQQQEEIHQKNLRLEKAQQVVETKAKELELASKYKSEFLANMSHELRTPLNSLLILAQLLAENKHGNLDDKQIEYARTIHSAGNDLLTLINEILDLSKIEAGKIEVLLEDISVSDLIEAIKQKFQHIADEKQLTFTIVIAEGMSPTLHTDLQRLKQIINNLLSNAFKFTTVGEVKLSISKTTDTLIFSVTDTGIGIPADKQQLIFEAFQQADGTTSRRYGGTGLGLSISRQLARLLGGELYVTSEVNRGSTFILHLPLIAAKKLPAEPVIETKSSPDLHSLSPAPIQAESVSQENVQENLEEHPPAIEQNDRAPVNPQDRLAILTDKKILIVDDDTRNTFALTTILEDKGMEVISKPNGKKALEFLAKQNTLDMILMDIMMPEMDGYETIRAIRAQERWRKLPIIALTAKAMRGDKAKCIEAGANDYLAKPIDTNKLLSLMKVWLYQ